MPDAGIQRPLDLPVLGQSAPERADAARNRRRILAAAESLVVSRGVAGLTMNEVAAQARVGVGTVYRRFGDLPGLIHAMMNERERRLQEAMLAGPPPLGPGAPPLQRITAFLHAYADLLEDYAPLMAVAEATMPPERRYGGGAYAVHHAHLARLLTDARPNADAHYLADVLLAPLAAGLFLHHRQHGISLTRIKAALDSLVTSLGAD